MDDETNKILADSLEISNALIARQKEEDALRQWRESHSPMVMDANQFKVLNFLLRFGFDDFMATQVVAGLSEKGLIAKPEPAKYCELVDAPKTYKRLTPWCEDHKKFATHCGPDGDTPVCEVFANENGCNCCPENYKKDRS